MGPCGRLLPGSPSPHPPSSASPTRRRLQGGEGEGCPEQDLRREAVLRDLDTFPSLSFTCKCPESRKQFPHRRRRWKGSPCVGGKAKCIPSGWVAAASKQRTGDGGTFRPPRSGPNSSGGSAAPRAGRGRRRGPLGSGRTGPPHPLGHLSPLGRRWTWTWPLAVSKREH